MRINNVFLMPQLSHCTKILDLFHIIYMEVQINLDPTCTFWSLL